MRDKRILCGCRFCGEQQHLNAMPVFERPVVRDGDTLKDAEGREVSEQVPGVHCEVCEAMAPLDVWNGQRSQADFAALRDFDQAEAA